MTCTDAPRGVVRMRLLYPLLFFTLVISSGYAAPQFTKCSKTLRALITPKQDTSVELEIDNTDPILSLLTTTDGTLAPLLPPKPTFSLFGFSLPQSFDQEFRGWSYERLSQEPWDNLTPNQKRLFLSWVTERKSTPFFVDRRVPGFKIKDKTSVTFKEPTDFLGTHFETGTHEIEISHLFRQVEYGSPSQNPSMLELHFRTNHPAGNVSHSAWTFLEGLDVAKPHQHVHIVTPLNIKRLQEEGQIRSIMLAEFYRRANLVLEMLSIVEEKHRGFSAVKSGSIIFWDNLSPERLENVYQHIEMSRSLGRQPFLGTSAKMAYVGFRGGDTYDDPSLFGFEVRGISKDSKPEYIKKYLNTIQWALTQDQFGIPKTEMEEWFAKYMEGKPFKFSSLWYNQPWEVLKANGFGHRFEEMIEPYFRKHFYDLEKNQELKMLIHDWSKDPLLFKNGKLLDLIRKKQIEALEKLDEGKLSQQKIVSDFLIQSGLYGIFTRSLGQ